MDQLRVERLHLRGYRAIRALDLPEDGLGWGQRIPDVVVVGGGNGSGKTTLLHWIVTAFRGLHQGVTTDLPREGRMDVSLDTGAARPLRFAYLAGPTAYVDAEASGTTAETGVSTPQLGRGARSFASAVHPRVLLVQSPRDLVLPHTEQKSAGRLEHATSFVRVWSPPRKWVDSAEALLYEARWLDLNAKEEGRPADATHFAAYADAFRALLPGRELVWRGGELVVSVIGTDVRHPLSAMSSGEKQILVVLAELLQHWAPGSVVLIDEPELHLHPSLQTRFYEALSRRRAQRGGQLWLATQSTELFGHAPAGTTVLLGAGSLL